MLHIQTRSRPIIRTPLSILTNPFPSFALRGGEARETSKVGFGGPRPFQRALSLPNFFFCLALADFSFGSPVPWRPDFEECPEILLDSEQLLTSRSFSFFHLCFVLSFSYAPFLRAASLPLCGWPTPFCPLTPLAILLWRPSSAPPKLTLSIPVVDFLHSCFPVPFPFLTAASRLSPLAPPFCCFSLGCRCNRMARPLFFLIHDLSPMRDVSFCATYVPTHPPLASVWHPKWVAAEQSMNDQSKRYKFLPLHAIRLREPDSGGRRSVL